MPGKSAMDNWMASDVRGRFMHLSEDSVPSPFPITARTAALILCG
jgi:hypothetical protein